MVSFLLILLAISILFDPDGHYWIFWDLLPAPLVFLTLIPWYFSLSFFPGSSSSLAYSLFFCPLLSTFYLLSPWERPQHSQQSKLSLSLILISKVSLFFQQPQSNPRFFSVSFPVFLNPLSCQASLFFPQNISHMYLLLFHLSSCHSKTNTHPDLI